MKNLQLIKKKKINYILENKIIITIDIFWIFKNCVDVKKIFLLICSLLFCFKKVYFYNFNKLILRKKNYVFVNSQFNVTRLK